MTDETPRRRTLSFPSDVAERLEREPNVSAYVTETVRARMRAEEAAAELAAAGFSPTPATDAHHRARRAAVEAAFPADRRAAIRRRVADAMAAEQPTGDAARRPAA
ncbi:hypothetical protein ACIBTV_27570 [Micromonospora sp. NPDC049366]|uniref:hypothetical protein n=1 Tax=Micromonospora sp. NPDC049366 TaxID=3364271 RepID=UPI00379AE62B